MSEGNEQRREPRVPYSGFVRLRGLGEEESIEAEIHNLSALGMFVASKKLPSPGASVFCRVMIGNDRRIIKGKVAWVAPDAGSNRPGAGIEFVDVTRQDSEVLRTVVTHQAEGPAPHEVAAVDTANLGRVEVEFEGLSMPVKARARMTPNGIVLTTALPFLRVGSDVRVRFLKPGDTGGEEAQQGRLEGVSFGLTGKDGVPRLLVELSGAHLDNVAPEVAPAPDVVVELQTHPQALTLPRPAIEQGRPWGSAPEELTDPDITPVVNTAVMAEVHVNEASELGGDDVTAVSSGPLTADVVSEPVPARVTQPFSSGRAERRSFVRPVLESIQVNLTPLPEFPAPSVMSAEPLLAGPPPVLREPRAASPHSHELSEDYGFPTAPSQHEGATAWKILIGAAVAVAAVAMLALHDNEPTASVPSENLPSTSEAPERHADIRIERLPAAPSPTQGRAAAPAGTAQAAAREEDVWEPISDPSWPFTVAAQAHSTTVFVPLRGSHDGHRLYDLTKPGGVGALLPQAQLTNQAGKFTVNQAGITQVWAEPRETGLHLRVLFGRSVVSHTATLEPDGLRVVVVRP